MAYRQLTAGALVLVALSSLAVIQAQNLQSPKVQGACNARFNATLATYYSNNQECANLIFNAFNTTVPARCPAGGTAVGSPVHKCMNNNNTGGVPEAWASLLAGCDYMYIANRQGAGESEAGFTYNQDSCFQPFQSWNAFTTWLYNAAPYGGVAKQTQAGGIAQVAMSAIVAGAALAAALVFA